MALNLAIFKTRTLTAIVFVIIMIVGLFLNYWSFLILFFLIHLGCWIEFENLSNLISPEYRSAPVALKTMPALAGFGFMCFNVGKMFSVASLTLSGYGFYLMIGCLGILLIGSIIKKNYKLLLFSMIGFVYISLSCGFMINFRTIGIISGNSFSLDFGLIMPLLIIASMWINDTMAYIVGSLIGKTQMSSISPKKTWEGTIGGGVLAVIVVTFLGYIFFKADVKQLIIITIIACTTGVLGDLFESKLKRLANVKDSGKIMPGHGGFLDRFDSLLMATIFVWLYIKLFL